MKSFINSNSFYPSGGAGIIELQNLKVFQIFEGYSVPLAKRLEKGYGYGFNGMERDDEVKGSGNSYDFLFRIYDPRLGKWLSLDPLQAKYPMLSPYNFVGNSPILFIDPDGRDIVNSRKMVLSNKTLIKKMKAFDLAVARLANKDVSSYKFVVSGGDRYKKDGKVYSATNHGHISKSASRSQHIQEEGATGVDLKFAEGVSYDIIKQAAEETGFRLDPSGTYDDHFHLDLRGSDEKMEYNANDYVPTDEDFAHGERKVSAAEKIDNYAKKLGPKLEKINNKLEQVLQKQEARKERRAARAERKASR